MKININSKDLAKVLGTALRAVPAKSSLPITEGFLLEAEDGTLKVTATDTNLTIIVSSPCEGEGRAVISAKTLTEIVRTLPDTAVSISTAEQSATVDWGNGHSCIPTLPVADFPLIPSADNSQPLYKVEASKFKNAIAHVIGCVATDQMRPALNGVFFDTSEGLALVASDTHVMSVYPLAEDKTDIASFIAPAAALSVVKDACSDGEVSFTSDGTTVFFALDGFTLIARCIVGKFPNWRIVMPKDNTSILSGDRNLFLGAVRRVSTCANKASGSLKFTLNLLDGCTIEAQDLGFNVSAREQLDCVGYEGEDITIGLKSAYLQQIVNVLEGENITLKFKEAKKAVCVESAGDVCQSIIMPVAIS